MMTAEKSIAEVAPSSSTEATGAGPAKSKKSATPPSPVAGASQNTPTTSSPNSFEASQKKMKKEIEEILEDADDEEEEDTTEATSKDKKTKEEDDEDDDADAEADAEGEVEGEGNEGEDDKKIVKKSRRELPPHTVAILKGWMLSPEHVKHPYPTDEDKQMLLKKTGINMKQLTNWFTNARKRIWKPMMRREHNRQMQNSIEYEKSRARDAYMGVPGIAGVPYPEGMYGGPRVIRHSFDAGSLGMPRDRIPPHHQMSPHEAAAAGYGHPHMVHGGPHHPHVVHPGHPHPHGGHPSMYPPPQPGMIPAAYPPRVVRSISESTHPTEMDAYIDAMRIRKRAHEQEAHEAAMEHEMRMRRTSGGGVRTAISSPRSIKVLQSWVAAHARHQDPFPVPNEPEKMQLARETGLEMHQIDMWFHTNRERMNATTAVSSYGVPPQSGSTQRSSIPSCDNPNFPPPPGYPRSSIPSNGNPMFPPRPVRSSIPSANNPNFPPPQLARGATGEEARPLRSLSINQSTGGSLPSLSSRNLINQAPVFRAGPTMGQPRDGRSHTLDVGLLTDARRRKMNFQDILASTQRVPLQPQHPNTSLMNQNNAENVYPVGPTTINSSSYHHHSHDPTLHSQKFYQHQHSVHPDAHEPHTPQSQNNHEEVQR